MMERLKEILGIGEENKKYINENVADAMPKEQFEEPDRWEQTKKPEESEDVTCDGDGENVICDGDAQGERSMWDYTIKEISALSEKNGCEDIREHIFTEGFMAFSKGRGGNLEENYRAYKNFTEAFQKSKGADIHSDDETDAVKGKRLHSGFYASSYRDHTEGLTSRQMELAREAGMSFREYEELLSSAPRKPQRGF